MGNILKKPIPISPELRTLEQDQNFKSITVQQDCQLCHFPIISPSSKFTNDNNCHHTICTKCISDHIESKLEMNAIEITCLGPDCKAVLDPVLCCDIVDPLPYSEWLDRLCYTAILGREKCYCPHGNCRALIVDECCDGESVPRKSKCPACKKWFCFLCRTAWHEGRNCDLSRGREMISLNDMSFMGMTVGLYKKFSCCPKCRSFTLLDRKTGFCIVRCRCKTVYCFHCEREMARLGCDPDCLGFELELHSYKSSLMIKWSSFVFLVSIALILWISLLADPDVYFLIFFLGLLDKIEFFVLYDVRS